MTDMMRLVANSLFTIGQHSIAATAIFLAVTLYIYSILDRRIPSLIVTPVVGALVYFGAFTYGELHGVDKTEILWERKLADAKQDLFDKYGKAALTLKYIEKQYENDKKIMAERQAEYQEELDELLEALNEKQDDKDVTQHVSSNGQAKSCLASPIPDSILRNLNKARS